MKKLLFVLCAFGLLAAFPARAFDSVRSAGKFVVFEDTDGVGCWCLAKNRIIEFYLSRENDERVPRNVVLTYDSGKIIVPGRSRSGRPSGNEANPGEVYVFQFRTADEAQRFIRMLIEAVKQD
ncbi:MAG: hypothetical protein RBU25_07270 [Lentisphaeria bacterium]|jgi:hypothetical protein|nr:hypothetical protein [Lentisphaeria bacterium]